MCSPARETQSGCSAVGVGRGAGLPSGPWEELPCGLSAPSFAGEGLCPAFEGEELGPSSVDAADLNSCLRKVGSDSAIFR